MRPGRLDRILYVGPPDAAGREEILRIRTRNMAIEPGVDFAQLSLLVSVGETAYHILIPPRLKDAREQNLRQCVRRRQ